MEQTPSPAPGGRARPGMITAVAVLLFIAGGLGVLGGLLLLTASAAVQEAAGLGGLAAVIAIVVLIVAAVEIYAGVLVLKLRERGRILAIAIAVISLVLQVLQIRSAAGTSIIGILINVFIIYACVTNKEAFSQQGI